MIWNMFMFFDLFLVRKNEIVVGLDTGAPVGYLDLYPQVFSFQNSYPHLWKIFPTDFRGQNTGNFIKIIKIHATIENEHADGGGGGGKWAQPPHYQKLVCESKKDN